MAAIAAAMTAVAIQPRALVHPVMTKSPMTLGAAASHIMIAMTGQARGPFPGLSDGISRRSGKNRDGQQTGADDAKGENRLGKSPRNGPQSLSGLGGCLDVDDADGVQRRARRDHDRKRDEVRKPHLDEGVQMNSVNRSLALMRRALEYLPGRERPDILCFLGGLPKKQVRADGGAEDGHYGCQVILVPMY
jgi:hypothetical protein